MKWHELIKALLRVPEARSHLKNVKKKLKLNRHDEILKESIEATSKNNSLKVIVKSYFWASRTLINCKCLPRSIALYQKLRATGYLVEHKFGINKQDDALAAHAWVEYQNKPLNESEDLKQRFDVMHYPD